MLNVINFFGMYGNAATFYFCVPVPASTDDDRVLNAAVPWIANDVTVCLDGGTPANIGTLPTRVGTSHIYTFSLTAAEMSAEWIVVSLIDADGPAWRDTIIIINTKLKLGQMTVDATQIGSNNHGIKATGVGTSPGFQAEGASDAYITNLFEQLEGTEPSGVPADNASVMANLQFIKRRFANKIDQSSTTQTQYGDDSATVVWTRTVSDDGSKQTIGKVA